MFIVNDGMIKTYNGSLFYKKLKPTFVDIWGDVQSFLSEYQSNGIQTTISEQSATTLYYLLYSRFGNTQISSWDTNRFKYDVWGTIFSYGPTWEKRLEIQEALRGISDDDLLTGSTQVYNHAYNPGTSPATSTLDELPAINEQNTSKNKRDKLSAYSILVSLLETDVTQQFLDKFKKLFGNNVAVGVDLSYATDTINDTIIGDGIGDGN